MPVCFLKYLPKLCFEYHEAFYPFNGGVSGLLFDGAGEMLGSYIEFFGVEIEESLLAEVLLDEGEELIGHATLTRHDLIVVGVVALVTYFVDKQEHLVKESLGAEGIGGVGDNLTS